MTTINETKKFTEEAGLVAINESRLQFAADLSGAELVRFVDENLKQYLNDKENDA